MAWATSSTPMLVGNQAGRVELHGDLPNTAALHLDPPDVGQAGETRAQGELGEVAEDDRVGAGELVLQHRENRWSEPLGAEVEPARQRGPK